MYRLILALLVLTACGREPPAVALYRAPAAPIYSSAVLEPARLTGHWVQVAGFAPACAAGHVDITATTATWDLCLTDRSSGSAPMIPGKPGRFAVAGMAWWVLWADADYRTLVIGTPGGQFGFVLNRGGALPPDRIKAARDILRFNGYDLTRFTVLAASPPPALR